MPATSARRPHDGPHIARPLARTSAPANVARTVVTSDRDVDALTELALQAREGDRVALEAICKQLQPLMYRLALRYTGNPTDAQDACQEVMVCIVTNLSTFEGRSRFTTWAYTVATRQLLRTTRRPTEASVANPEAFATFLETHQSPSAWLPESQAEYDELCADVRLSCTYGMLLCLTRPQRLAYLLGDVLGFTDTEAATMSDVSPAAFRQRLARARAVMRFVMGQHCGLVRSTNPCRCNRMVDASIRHGLLDQSKPAWARHNGVSLPIETTTVARAASQLDLVVAVAEVYRTSPQFESPTALWDELRMSLPDLT
jgi:RNA polymerase sigma factor (sigma-70 family)